MKRKEITKEELENMYYDCKMSTIVISNYIGCSKTTILRKMNKFNIDRRNRANAQIELKNRGYVRYNFKEKPKCIDCGKKLAVQSSIRCVVCRGKSITGSNHPMFGVHRYGNKAGGYKDGRHPLNRLLRKLYLYSEWRTSVYERDNFTCKECNSIGCVLNSHHIKPFAKILSEFLKEYDQFSPFEDKETLLRLASKYKPFWDLENGITLCKDCHKEEHKKRK